MGAEVGELAWVLEASAAVGVVGVPVGATVAKGGGMGDAAETAV